MKRWTPCFVFALLMTVALGSSDVEKKKAKEIEKWLTKINEEDLAITNPPLITKPDNAPDCENIDDENCDYSWESEKEEEQRNYEISWHANTTREAQRLYKECKDLLFLENKTALRLLELYALEGALMSNSQDMNDLLEETKTSMYNSLLRAMDKVKEQCFHSPRNFDVSSSSQNCTNLRCIWEAWHDEIGLDEKEDFNKIVKLSKDAAQENDFEGINEVWKIQETGNKNVDIKMKNLLEQIMPLYKELHAYVRRKLFDKYYNNAPNDCGPKPSDKDPIPVHLTGNILGREWSQLESLVLPYPNAPLLDFSALTRANNVLSHDLARFVEEFYVSLGFKKFNDYFWTTSSFNRTDLIICYPEIEDALSSESYSVTVCPNLSLIEFGHLCHELSHIMMLRQTEHLPYRFRHPYYSTFYEGLGVSMELMINTPWYLKKIFNLTSGNTEAPIIKDDFKEEDINVLMRSALYRLPYIPFGFAMDAWRIKVFSGSIQPNEYNRQWWKLRKIYQGISPPMERSEDNFDPGAVLHVAMNNPIIKFFFRFFLEFQIHKSLCELSGHTGLLHRCNVYGSKVVGDKLRDIFAKGNSKPPLELLRDLTGYQDYDASPMLEYYKPLREWLEKQNKGYTVGWDNEA